MTMIKIHKETAQRLSAMKEYKNQTYDEVINSILKKDHLSKEDIENIEQGLKDIKEGRTHTSEEVARKLGIKK